MVEIPRKKGVWMLKKQRLKWGEISENRMWFVNVCHPCHPSHQLVGALYPPSLILKS